MSYGTEIRFAINLSALHKHSPRLINGASEPIVSEFLHFMVLRRVSSRVTRVSLYFTPLFLGVSDKLGFSMTKEVGSNDVDEYDGRNDDTDDSFRDVAMTGAHSISTSRQSLSSSNKQRTERGMHHEHTLAHCRLLERVDSNNMLLPLNREGIYGALEVVAPC